MANPIYNQFSPNNNFDNIIRQAQNLKSQFQGNPKDEVQRLLNQGIMTQSDFNRLMPIAQQIAALMPKR